MDKDVEDRIASLETQIDALVLVLQELVAIHRTPEGAKELIREGAEGLVADARTPRGRSVREFIGRCFPRRSEQEDLPS